MPVEIDSTWYQRPPRIRSRRGAGGVVVRPEKGQALIALIRGDGLPGYLLPKGGVRRSEPIVIAARREIEEEAGLSDLQLLEPLGIRERLSFDHRRWQVTHYFLFLTTQCSGTPTDKRHKYLVEWFPIHGLPTMFWPEQRELLEDSAPRIEEIVSEL